MNELSFTLLSRYLSMDGEAVESASSAPPIAAWRLLMAMLGPVVFIGIFYYLQLGLVNKLIQGVVRSSAQLLFLGYVLLNFIFSLHSVYAVALYMFCMILIAALECTGRQLRTYPGQFWDALVCCLCGGGLVGVYANVVIFHPRPWWRPEVMIPTAGMIIGNAVSGPAQAVERLLSDATERGYELETRLAFGASAYEAILPMLKTSVQTALLPNLNQMAIMGLVSIPGMMTGQLLGGTAPLIAAQYQMAILYLILTTSVISTVLSVLLAIRHGVFHMPSHRVVAGENVKKREGGKQDIDKAMYQACLSLYNTATYYLSYIRQLCSVSSSSASKNNDNANTSYSPLSSIEMTSQPLDEESLHSSLSPNSSLPELSSGRVTYSLEENQEFRPLKQSAHKGLVLRGLNITSSTSLLFHEQALALTLLPGEIVTLEGPSGIGKTRLLRAIAQLDLQHTGQMSFNNTVLKASKAVLENNEGEIVTVPSWRKHIIYVPQALPPMVGCPKDLIEESCSYHTRAKEEGTSHVLKDLEGQMERIEQSLHLSAGILTSAWSTLSGGERQRALIACAILLACSLQRPAVLLLDEPTAACDPATTLAVEAVLQASQATILMTTHDERQAKRIAHRRLLLTPLQSAS